MGGAGAEGAGLAGSIVRLATSQTSDLSGVGHERRELFQDLAPVLLCEIDSLVLWLAWKYLQGGANGYATYDVKQYRQSKPMQPQAPLHPAGQFQSRHWNRHLATVLIRKESAQTCYQLNFQALKHLGDPRHITFHF
jgi:hypothetical protein